MYLAAADTGFIGQNVYLYCATQGLAAVFRAMIDRQELAKALKLRPDQRITFAQTVGLPESAKQQHSGRPRFRRQQKIAPLTRMPLRVSYPYRGLYAFDTLRCAETETRSRTKSRHGHFKQYDVTYEIV
jgi:hypothetical protein